MSGVERRTREFTTFEIETRPRKRSGSRASTGAGTSGSGARRAPAGSAAANSPKRAPASGTRATAGASKGRTSASTTKRTNTAATKRTGTPAKRTNVNTSTTKRTSAPAKRTSAPAKRTNAQTGNRRRSRVEENPVAMRDPRAVRGYDRYDTFDVPPRRNAREDRLPPRQRPQDRPPQRKKNASGGGKGRRRSPVNAATFLLLMLIAGLAGVGVWRQQAYAEFVQKKAVVAQQTFYAGTTVEGVDVSQMTLQEALDHWNSQIEPQYREAAAVLNDGTRLTASQMGYFSDYESVLAGAWNSGRHGSLLERYNRIALHRDAPSSYGVTRTLYDDTVVRNYAAQLAAQVDAEPKDASLLAFDFGSQSFQYAPEEAGRTLNQDALVASIEGALDAGGGDVSLEIASVQPAVTLENVSAQYGMISSAVTNASSSKSNRLSNISLAISLINGTTLGPGETFSFNGTVGKRTTERGFKTAAAYSSGEVTEEVGGGICQVSTTLFNAAVKANLTIKERSSHSLTVSYVDIGKDAAVDWGNKDLKFVNSTSEPVYICCYLSEDKRVHFGIFGRLLPDGMTITLESKKSGTIDYETEYRVNFNMASGSTKTVQAGKNGTSAVTYKVYWDASGNEIQREQLCKSNYRATKEIIEYGP